MPTISPTLSNLLIGFGAGGLFSWVLMYIYYRPYMLSALARAIPTGAMPADPYTYVRPTFSEAPVHPTPRVVFDDFSEVIYVTLKDKPATNIIEEDYVIRRYDEEGELIGVTIMGAMPYLAHLASTKKVVAGTRFVEDYVKWATEAEPLIADFKQSGCSSWVEYLGRLNKQGESK